jgi:uracil-DNA glycosylase
MMRILIVGQGPSKGGEGTKPLDGPGTGDKLAELAGLPREEMLSRCTAVNLLSKWYGKNGHGDKFPSAEAKKQAEKLRNAWKDFDRIVLLGWNVASAFHIKGSKEECLRWTTDKDGHVVAVVPHPSGASRWYNEPKNTSAAEKFMRGLFDGTVQAIVPQFGGRKERAELLTDYLKRFDANFDWTRLAETVIEVERDELYVEVGFKTMTEWITGCAPRSYRLCYMVKARYKALIEVMSLEEMKRIPAETADWASKVRNISRAALAQPEVKEALRLPKQKAIAAIKEIVPNEHVEQVKNWMCKFAQSQHESVSDAFECFKRFKDEKASFEDFVEFLASEFMASPHPDGGTFSDRWEQVSGKE